MSFLGLEGKRVLVTGASSGIGRAIALELDQAGAHLHLLGRDLDRLEAVSKACCNPTRTYGFDLSTHLDKIPSFLKSLAEAEGTLSGIVHAAGIQMLKPLRMSSPDDLHAVFSINVTAGLMLTRGLRQPGVRAELASMIFISSVMASAGAPGRAVYSGSKGALEAATRSLALELAPENIRVNCIAPGFVASEMLEMMRKRLGPEQVALMENNHPLGFGQPEDIGKAAAFLMGSCSRWITGTTLVVDGGYLAH